MSRRKIFMNLGKLSTLNNGLVAYWNLENNSNDGVGINNGTDHSISYGAAKVGRGATFNGTTSYINVPHNAILNPMGSFTYSFWYKPNASVAFAGLLQKYTNAPSNGYLIFIQPSGVITLGIDDGTYITISSTSLIGIGFWNMITCTYDASALTMEIFINASSENSYSGILAPSTTTTDLVFGGDNISTNRLNGSLDEIGYWNRALTGAEISELYNSGIGKTTPF